MTCRAATHQVRNWPPCQVQACSERQECGLRDYNRSSCSVRRCGPWWKTRAGAPFV